MLFNNQIIHLGVGCLYEAFFEKFNFVFSDKLWAPRRRSSRSDDRISILGSSIFFSPLDLLDSVGWEGRNMTLATRQYLRMCGAVPQLPTTSLYAYGNRHLLFLIKNTNNFSLTYKFLCQIYVNCNWVISRKLLNTKTCISWTLIYRVLLLLSVGFPAANAPDVLQPCGLLYYP